MTLARQTSVETPAALVAAWQRAYAQRLLITDLIVIVVSVYTSQFIRFGTSGEALRIPGEQGGVFELSYTLVSALLAFGWLCSLALFATRDRNIVGAGTTEYKRIADATIRVFARARHRRVPAAVGGRTRLPARRAAARARAAARLTVDVAQVAHAPTGDRRVLAPGDAHGRAPEVACTWPSRWPATPARASSSSARSPSEACPITSSRPASRCSATTRASPGSSRTRVPTPSCSPEPTPSTRGGCAASAGSSRPPRRTSSSLRRSRMSRARASTPVPSPASRSSRSTIPSSRAGSTPRSARSTSSSRSSHSWCSAPSS